MSLRSVWNAGWPKVAAIVIALVVWELVALSGWKPDYVLPGPVPVLKELGHEAITGQFWHAVGITLSRAVIGFAIAIVVGSLLGVLVAASRTLRSAIGSLITGIQTMPSIAWFPLAILLFQLSEKAILFVVVLGAAPSIANGLIAGVDYVPPLLVRAGRSLGAKGARLYRHVVLPATIPTYVAGLKQGWAFAWRSLMAGELLVIVAHRPSLGVRLQVDRDFGDATALISTMIVILVLGILADAAFTGLTNRIRERFGLIEAN